MYRCNVDVSRILEIRCFESSSAVLDRAKRFVWKLPTALYAGKPRMEDRVVGIEREMFKFSDLPDLASLARIKNCQVFHNNERVKPDGKCASSEADSLIPDGFLLELSFSDLSESEKFI